MTLQSFAHRLGRRRRPAWLLPVATSPQPGTVKDEAMRAGRTAASFPAADEDYFADMDGGYKRDTDPEREAQRERGARPQYLDRVDRRQ